MRCRLKFTSFAATKIHETLISLPEYQRATNLSIYLSMPGGEASTEPAVLHALDLGKKVFVPYLHESSASGESRTLMDMVKLHSKEDYVTLPPDKWGIPTPSKDSIPRRGQCLGIFNDKAQEQDKIETSDLHIVVMPGVAFDSKCQRLGHGKGFYDIFLSQYRKRLASQGKMPFLGKNILTSCNQLRHRSRSSPRAAGLAKSSRSAHVHHRLAP